MVRIEIVNCNLVDDFPLELSGFVVKLGNVTNSGLDTDSICLFISGPSCYSRSCLYSSHLCIYSLTDLSNGSFNENALEEILVLQNPCLSMQVQLEK